MTNDASTLIDWSPSVLDLAGGLARDGAVLIHDPTDAWKTGDYLTHRFNPELGIGRVTASTVARSSSSFRARGRRCGWPQIPMR